MNALQQRVVDNVDQLSPTMTGGGDFAAYVEQHRRTA
jgi:hypothetical protein